MLHGIVVLSSTKAVKYSLVPLCFCTIFKYFLKNPYGRNEWKKYLLNLNTLKKKKCTP